MEWLYDAVREDMGNGVDVVGHVMAIRFPPSNEAYTYRALRAYGNHFRSCNVDGGAGMPHLIAELQTCSGRGLGPVFVTRTW